ncbi:DUF3892 domain-containing protein [Streptomyces sp. CA-111067]|uniref:DUF3892 domain-containing protein n=1 Tax=Streptomyces sp. CA-111067 TaxID=3240046 RepID=UPI003D98DF38
MRIYITAVHLEGGAGHEHIQSVKWQDVDTGETEQSTRAAIVSWLGKSENTAWVHDGVGAVQVLVVRASPPYIRSYADGRWTDNLLALPRF